MAAESDDPTLADYITSALNPILIMILVGSLVFFLLEVCYAGAYGADMRWTLFFFVMAVVLIARITMIGGTEGRVGCYAPVLGFAVWMAMQRYVQFPADGPPEGLRAVINLCLIAIIWWCAHRLTWDCTYQGKEVDSGGEGLLKAAGLEEAGKPPDDALTAADGNRATPAKPVSWLERYRRYQEERKKKKAQGTWVIYFSLAALPLFGLGQSLIPVEAEARRQYAFWLMTLYVGSSLGLLLTTSFLGMRRYLRQRKLKMPAALAGVWLSVGTALIVVLLLLGTFLPRPNSEYPLIDFKPLGAQDLEASKYAVRGENAGKNQGRPGTEGKDKEENKGDGKDDQAKDKDQQDKDGKEKDSGKKGDDKEKGGSGGQRDKEKGSSKQKGASSKSQSRNSSRILPPFFANVAPILKWIVFAIVAVIVLVVVLRSGLSYLANFFEWARKLLESLRNFFAGLFGGSRRRSAAEDARENRKAAEHPFASFANPFHDGRAGSMSVKDLLCYSFSALQAWARERGYPRQAGETPLEFVARLGDELPAMEAPARRLTNLFVRAVYAPEVLPKTCEELIEAFWEQLETAADRRVPV
jgi:Domain of unknown function (DUF4129)